MFGIVTNATLSKQIAALSAQLSTQGTKLMDAIDDLNTSIANLGAQAQALITGETAAITAAMAAGNTAAIESAVGNINAIASNLASATAALPTSGAVTPAQAKSTLAP